MGYRLEKTTTGVDLVIDGWEKGIAESPFAGIADMRQVNIISQPGSVMVGYGITTSTTSGGTLGVPISRATQYSVGLGNAVSYFILDNTGHVWQSTSLAGTWTLISSNETTSGAGVNDAIWFWKGFIFKTRGDKIDYNPVNGTGTTGAWVNGWVPTTGSSGGTVTSFTGGTNHFALTPIDGSVYICNGAYVSSLTEVSTFDPTTPATFTWTVRRFSIAYNDSAISLCAIGSGGALGTLTILVGGSQNAIYPFGTAQAITTPGFQTPIFVGDNFIARMVSANQNAFIFTGGINPQTGNQAGRGRIYICNTVQAQEFFKIPDSIRGYNDIYYLWGDAMFHRDSLVFSFQASANSNGDPLVGVTDVWAIDIGTKAFRSISTLTSSSGYSNASVLIPDQSNATKPGYSYMVGWSDGTGGTVRNIGYSGTTSGVGTAIVFTDQIPVGTFFTKYTWQQVEVRLQTPLQSGESVQIIGFKDNASTGSIVTINTVGAISGYGTANFDSSQWIQFELALTGNSATSGARVRDVRVHGTPVI